MADPRTSFRSARSLYSAVYSQDEEEYSNYDDDMEYYSDEYDDDQYSRGDQYDNRNSSSAVRNNNRYSRDYHRGGGGGRGGREIVEYDDDDYDSYADDYSREGGGGHRGGGGGRHGGGNGNNYSRSNGRNSSRSNKNNGSGSGERKLVSILPGTPKQAQDIIRNYSLGMSLQHPTHMALPPTTPPEGPAREIATLQVANLIPQEYAFVRRSNGQWTFAQVAVRHDSLEQLVFIVNKGGSTKSFKRFEWPGFVRRIKWTERRVQLPKALKEIPTGNTTTADGSSPQLALANGGKSTSTPSAVPNKPKEPEVTTMTLKEMKIELQQLGIDYSVFMEKQEFRNAVIDGRAEAVKNALIREQQAQRRQQEAEQQKQQQQQNHGFDNFNEINLNSTLEADISNLAGQTISLQPQDDEVSELMGDYLLTEYKFQMKVLERERLKKQGGVNKMTSINEHGGNVTNADGQQSSAYQSFNIEGEGEKKLPHYEKQAFAKSQKWGASVSEDV
eukprot:scaffold4881_cov201-Skeletonema_marinoi.AAC.4